MKFGFTRWVLGFAALITVSSAQAADDYNCWISEVSAMGLKQVRSTIRANGYLGEGGVGVAQIFWRDLKSQFISLEFLPNDYRKEAKKIALEIFPDSFGLRLAARDGVTQAYLAVTRVTNFEFLKDNWFNFIFPVGTQTLGRIACKQSTLR